MRNNKVRSAYHEVGHAVACDESGVVWSELSIVPRDDDTVGRIASGLGGPYLDERDPLASRNEAAYRQWADEQSVIDYAGHAAVVALLGLGDMSDESAAQQGAASDFAAARDRLMNDESRIVQAKSRAMRVVRAKTAEIELVARELIKAGTLSEWEVYGLLCFSAMSGDLLAQVT